MKRNIVCAAFAGFGLATLSFAMPAFAQVTLDDDPLTIEDGNTGLGDEDKTDENGLVPLFVPGTEKTDTDGLIDSDDAQPEEPELLTREGVTLRGLDKITGESIDLNVNVGEQKIFGGLRVTVRACHQTPPTEPPESIAYVEIEDYGFGLEEGDLKSDEVDKEKRVFHGWMYASSPGIHALEHSIYDVWVIRCTAATPDVSDESSKS